YQRDQTVHKYVHEIESLFMMAGVVSDQEKIDKLWNGLNTHLQKGLWREKLTPTSCTWEELVDTAVFLEMAESVGDTRRQPK
ncbi:hypothetical protein B0H21DRAFT_660195, partial [Amylocystis lapponica]